MGLELVRVPEGLMSVGTLDRAMAKRNDETTKVDSAVLRKARAVASLKGVSLAELLSEILRPEIDRMFRELAASEMEPEKPKGKGKPER